ncbi:uncharacterized protein LOC111296924 isoform X6 [Durio zibethinus]|uniref:Uncharacterized protein LOC111296924 isoform X6 n=1 Tax=Durio zibethinus TaxID=66656 RepID=A0A6P5Z3G7_DURZI|nr:uncharacterized protein LOC111296924 isoform X6 [Durio zibethinus]
MGGQMKGIGFGKETLIAPYKNCSRKGQHSREFRRRSAQSFNCQETESARVLIPISFTASIYVPWHSEVNNLWMTTILKSEDKEKYYEVQDHILILKFQGFATLPFWEGDFLLH